MRVLYPTVGQAEAGQPRNAGKGEVQPVGIQSLATQEKGLQLWSSQCPCWGLADDTNVQLEGGQTLRAAIKDIVFLMLCSGLKALLAI